MTKSLSFVIGCLVFSLPIVALAYVPSDPLYPEQVYLDQINIEEAWDISQGQGVIVAIIDSGVDIDHPDLEFNIWINQDEIPDDNIDNDQNGYVDDVHGWDFLTDSADPNPKIEENYNVASINHGTALAGLIAAVANNNKGITGVAFKSKIMPIRIMDHVGDGNVADLISAIEYAVNNGADIINLSIVGYDFTSDITEAIEWAHRQDVVVVTSSGNMTQDAYDGIDLDFLPAYPACCGDNDGNNIIIAASAVDSQDVRAAFANYGSCIDLTAPGQGLMSLGYYDPDQPNFADYYSYDLNGTSFSTALVSGVAALVKSKDPDLGSEQVIEAVVNYTDDISDKNPEYLEDLGTGRLNAQQSLEAEMQFQLGKLVKLANDSAVYYVDTKNIRHLFPNQFVFFSWYGNNWAAQPIALITQSQFDSLEVGDNIRIRPGTNLIKYSNSPKLYIVNTGGVIQNIAEDLAAEIFGSDYEDRVIVMQPAFETDYKKNSAITEVYYPNYSLIQYRGSEAIYFLDNGSIREVTDQGFINNRFQRKYLIDNVPVKYSYKTGFLLDGWDKTAFKYKVHDL